MHAQLSNAFEASVDNAAASSHERLQKNARNPNLAPADPGHEETEAEARARRVQARIERDLPENGLMNLKNDALEWFQVWRDGIVGMVVDALNAKSADVQVTGAEIDESPPPAYEVYGGSSVQN
jgi:hypothetical protein